MRDDLDDDEVEHAPEPKRWLYWTGAGVLLAGLAAFFLLPHNQTKHANFNDITTVTLPPPPPPPKPPPPQPQKPQPSEPQKSVSTSTPHNAAAHAASHNSGLTARAGAGSNAYGLQAGDGSGGDTIGGGDDGQDWSSYSPGIASAMQSVVSNDTELSAGRWQARVQIWFAANGVITKVELAESSGDASRDRKIKADYLGVKVISNPPADMPQPITVSISAAPA